MFNIMNLNNIENIFYWTDNNGAVSLPGDTALTYRTKSDLPRFVAAPTSEFWLAKIQIRMVMSFASSFPLAAQSLTMMNESGAHMRLAL